jgi:hypothetical protein
MCVTVRADRHLLRRPAAPGATSWAAGLVIASALILGLAVSHPARADEAADRALLAAAVTGNLAEVKAAVAHGANLTGPQSFPAVGVITAAVIGQSQDTLRFILDSAPHKRIARLSALLLARLLEDADSAEVLSRSLSPFTQGFNRSSSRDHVQEKDRCGTSSPSRFQRRTSIEIRRSRTGRFISAGTRGIY